MYNSDTSFSSRLGVNWRSEYDASFTIIDPGQVNVVLPDGSPYHFTFMSGHWVSQYWSLAGV